MKQLEIVYLSPGELTPYEGNARKHAEDDIEQIKQSILADGFNDPIGIWGKENLIVEGHGRQIAALEMGLEKVPCIRLDHLTETQRRDYAIRHNRTAELSGWDFSKLEEEIAALEIEGVDLSGLNFTFEDIENIEQNTDSDGKYSTAVNVPQYEPSGVKPDIKDLVKLDKVRELIADIDKSKLPEEEKEFLRVAAYRHAVIDFDKVADYYAESGADTQRLMEDSALVIIDFNDAIAKGYVQLSKSLEMIMESDNDE